MVVNLATIFFFLVINFQQLDPAFHCNLFLFKEKRKRIFITIWATAEFFRTRSLLISTSISHLPTPNSPLPSSISQLATFLMLNPFKSKALKKKQKNIKKSLVTTIKSCYLCTPQEGKFISIMHKKQKKKSKKLFLKNFSKSL